MKRLRTLIAIAGISFAFTVPSAIPAQAAVSHDTKLSVTVSPAPSTFGAGTNFDVTLKVSNVGAQPVRLQGMNLLYFKKSITFSGFSASYPDTNCGDVIDLGTVTTPNPDYWGLVCDIPETLEIVVAPGAFETFTYHLTTNAPFSDGITKMHAISYPTDYEEEGPELSAKLERLQYLSELEAVESEHVWNYTYEAEASAPTTNATKTSASTSNKTQGTASVNGNSITSGVATGIFDGDSLVNEGEAESDATEKAEVAIDLRNALPDRVTREDPSALEALLSGNYKYQTMLALMSIAVALGMFYTMRKRYFKKIQIEKEYRKALKARSIFSSIDQ